MSECIVSLNQLVEFPTASDAGKKRIIKQQLQPNPFKIPWYQLTKAKVKKSIELNGDLSPVYEGIRALMAREPSNKRQLNDKNVSIEALERFIRIKLPTILNKIEYKIIHPKIKILKISDVDVIVAPEIVVKGVINGQTVLGGIKLHISKHKPFDYKKSVYVATTIHEFLKEKVALSNEIVIPELCFSLDIFGDRIVSAPDNSEDTLNELEQICSEFKLLWNLVAAA